MIVFKSAVLPLLLLPCLGGASEAGVTSGVSWRTPDGVTRTCVVEGPSPSAPGPASTYRLVLRGNTPAQDRVLLTVDPVADGKTISSVGIHVSDEFPDGILEVRGARGAVGTFIALLVPELRGIGEIGFRELLSESGRAITWYDFDCSLSHDLLVVLEATYSAVPTPKRYVVVRFKKGAIASRSEETGWPPPCRKTEPSPVPKGDGHATR